MANRLQFQTAVRAGTMALLEAYCADQDISAQIYRARPKMVKPPTLYIESISEILTPFTLTTRQRTPRAIIRALWGLFDAGDAVDQRDPFIDGFLDYVADNFHMFGGNTDANAVGVADDPEFDFGGSLYFSSMITLEGFAST